MGRKIFIGGAWPYANNSMHIGHLAALLPGDVLARFHRQKGNEVIYVSGTDSHGTPITLRAKAEKVSPEKIASLYHEEFSKNFNDLNFSYDLYSSTSSDYHKKLVEDFFVKIYENGYIYEKEEEQDFCQKCETYLSDREIEGTCPHCKGHAKGDQCESCLRTLSPNEILEKVCKQCNGGLIMKKNKHLYFKLSAFQEEIERLVKKNEGSWRKNAVNESRKYLDMGLRDRATTRQLDWGVDVPIEGYKDKRIYVWIEAVMGYLTAGNFVAQQKGIDFKEFLKDEKDLTIYFVHGKDNIPFHTVIFPALLKAIDEQFVLPHHIISSEYVNVNEEKMSKSKGNLLTVNELVENYNKDTIRYYITAFGPEKRDVNFSENDLIQTHNKFLVGVLGNFINRNLSFIKKKFEGRIVESEIDKEIKALTKETFEKVDSLMEQGELRSAIDACMNYVYAGNKYYDEQKPWIKVKEDITEFNKITYTCVYMIVNIANMFAPFMPDTCDSILEMLGLKKNAWGEVKLKGDLHIKETKLLFERMDLK